jgi:hypothetical protein
VTYSRWRTGAWEEGEARTSTSEEELREGRSSSRAAGCAGPDPEDAAGDHSGRSGSSVKWHSVVVAELTAEERDQILFAFLREYSRASQTNYVYSNDGPPDTDIDWICRDPDKPGLDLKIQNVRAWADQQTEIIHPKDVENYVVGRLKSLAEEAKLTGYLLGCGTEGSSSIGCLPKLPVEQRDYKGSFIR